MKIFISADIEGVTTTTSWSDENNALHTNQMTEEVLACVRGAKKAGATEIYVKDAHGNGVNIDPSRMPSGVCLLRNWSGHPYMMVEGVDKTFDAAMFVGYHSAATRAGNPMSHTVSGCQYIKINDELASEFMIYSYACAFENVPTVFLSGDKMLCDEYKNFHPNLVTCAVKDGRGAMSVNYSPEDTLKNIEKQSESALSQKLDKALISLPKFFNVEICYKEHAQAEKVSYFPGVKKIDDTTVSYESSDYFEVLRALNWIL